MSLSNLALRIADHEVSDQLSDPPRAKLRVVATNDTATLLMKRPRPSLQHRNIVIRDQGFRAFRIR